MKRKFKIAAAILAASLFAGACKEKMPQTAAKKPEAPKWQANLDVIQPTAYSNVDGLDLEPGTYISIIGKSSGTPYWDQVEAGVKQAEKDLNEHLGYKGEDKVKVNFSGPDGVEDSDTQINILDEELGRGPAAVGIAIIDTASCQVQFDLATDDGIPLVAFDSGSDYNGIQSMCSTDNVDAAKKAAVKLAGLLDNRGEIALFVHDSSSSSARERETAFLEELQTNFPEVKAVNVYHLDDMNAVATEIANARNTVKKIDEPETLPEDITQDDIIHYIFETNPNITGCYATNEDAMKVLVSALNKIGKEDLAIVGFDGGKEQLKLLADGTVDGLIVQNPFGMGYASVIAAARASLGIGNEAFVDTSYLWVTKENMEKENIKKMLY